MKNNKAKAYIMLIVAMLIFGTVGIFRKYIPIPSALLAFARGLIGSVFLFCFTKAKNKNRAPRHSKKTLMLLVLTGAVLGLNWILLFEAYNFTTVSTATLCYYMEPTILILLSPVIFREKLTARKTICAVLAIAGMVLVSGVLDDYGTSSGIKGILLGLGAAALYSAVVILNKIIDIDDMYNKTVIELLSAAIVLIPYLIATKSFSSFSFTPVSVGMIAAMGILHTGIAYALYFSSIKVLSGQSIAILSYIDPVSALVLSALILDERMTVYGIIGAVLIIASAAVSEIDFKKIIGRP